MKQGIVNYRWAMLFPDSIADWDAITHWERERFQSYVESLCWGDFFVDVGAEHGWMSALIGREIVGPQNMFLVEPSSEMWRNIWLTWRYNDLPDPAGSWCGFVGDEDHRQGGLSSETAKTDVWPSHAIGHEECDAMAYRSLLRDSDVPSVTIDDLYAAGRFQRRVAGMSIDVEGAELLVLRGARRVLMADRPLVWVSIHVAEPGTTDKSLIEDFGHTRDDVLAFMADCGYTADVLGYQHEEHVLFRPQ